MVSTSPLREPVNVPPEWTLNTGFGYNADRWFFNANANYQDEAFWADLKQKTGQD